MRTVFEFLWSWMSLYSGNSHNECHLLRVNSLAIRRIRHRVWVWQWWKTLPSSFWWLWTKSKWIFWTVKSMVEELLPCEHFSFCSYLLFLNSNKKMPDYFFSKAGCYGSYLNFIRFFQNIISSCVPKSPYVWSFQWNTYMMP